jgi:very-short-patch-repair endonuclease
MAQAERAGIPRGIARGHQRAKRWVAVFGSVWTTAQQEVGILQKCWAAMLTWPDCVIFGPSALAAWQMLGMVQTSRMPLPADGVLWLSLNSYRRNVPGVRILQVPAVLDSGRSESGLRIARFEDSLFDSLATLPSSEADALFAWLASRRMFSSGQFEHSVERFANRTGVVRLRRYQELAGTGAASELEFRLHLLLRRACISGWTANAPIRVNGRIVASADVLFAGVRLIVEVDGYSSHRSAESFSADRQRWRMLVQAGYRLLVFTWHDVVGAPADVVAQILRAIQD